VVKINFPGSAARQTSFTANANQSNESVTVVKNQYPIWYKSIPFLPCDNPVPATRAHRAEIDFYCGG